MNWPCRGGAAAKPALAVEGRFLIEVVLLNVRNAWGNDQDMPVKANPDGTIAVIRIPNETRWYLTNTFGF